MLDYLSPKRPVILRGALLCLKIIDRLRRMTDTCTNVTHLFYHPMPTHTNDQIPSAVEPIIEALNKLLASTVDFYFLYKGAHWNLKNTHHFYHLHELFDKHAGQVYPHIDLLAERIRVLTGTPDSNLATYKEHSVLGQISHTDSDVNAILNNLRTGHTEYITLLRKSIEFLEEKKDYANVDYLTSILQEHTLMRWFIASNIAGEGEAA